MASNLDITQTAVPDMNNWTDTSIDLMQTDGISDLKETESTNSLWTQFWGIFNDQPEVKSAILLKATWNVGKGYTTSKVNQLILNRVTGQGNESFDDVLFNMEVIRRVARDSFAAIMRDENDELVNVKPLDPGSIRVIYDGLGIIKRYEQISRLGFIRRMFHLKAKTLHKFEPEEIFHLSNNRLADQIHGISDIESLKETILAEKESFDDIRRIMHQQGRPFIIFKYKTDDKAKIDEIADKIDRLREKGNDLHIPDDDNVLSHEVVQVNVSQIVMEWRNDIRNKFYRSIGLPQIQAGAGGQGTESDSKVIYLAFEQLVERDQRYIEQQVLAQLGIRINLIPPATLAVNLQQDEKKDAGQGLVTEPADTTLGAKQ